MVEDVGLLRMLARYELLIFLVNNHDIVSTWHPLSKAWALRWISQLYDSFGDCQVQVSAKIHLIIDISEFTLQHVKLLNLDKIRL